MFIRLSRTRWLCYDGCGDSGDYSFPYFQKVMLGEENKYSYIGYNVYPDDTFAVFGFMLHLYDL